MGVERDLRGRSRGTEGETDEVCGEDLRQGNRRASLVHE